MAELGAIRTTQMPESSRSLLDQALAVAARQPSPNTRRAYTSTYRSFCAFLDVGHQNPRIEDLTSGAVQAYCDFLERQGRSQATIARHLSALRSLAEELGLDPTIQEEVKVERPSSQQPSSLAEDEYEALLSAPDTRIARGKRDLAILRLLGDCGLRRSELCAVQWQDIEHVADCLAAQTLLLEPEQRTSYELVVRKAEGEQMRRVPLTRGSLEALFAWRGAQPVASGQHVFASTRKASAPLSDRMVANVVRAHAEEAGLPEHCCSPHALRHTFCARLARNGASPQQIAELAGHIDMRTAKLYAEGSALSVA